MAEQLSTLFMPSLRDNSRSIKIFYCHGSPVSRKYEGILYLLASFRSPGRGPFCMRWKPFYLPAKLASSRRKRPFSSGSFTRAAASEQVTQSSSLWPLSGYFPISSSTSIAWT